jgi:RloB-like protein
MQSRARQRFSRRGPVREPYDVVLVVCEGSKTEPSYLQRLRVSRRLSSVNIRIVPPPRGDPLTIVNFAIRQLEVDPEYDRGYCVFDRNQHATFDTAIRRVIRSNLGREGRLIAIPSTPCFEVWILLHYLYSTSPYVAAGGVSACDRVIRDVQQHFPTYAKGHRAVFAELMVRLNQAVIHAHRLESHNAVTGTANPATTMHHLVNYLIALKP